MSFRYFIALRYLISKKEAGFITVISLISIIGVMVGVAALIIVLSVFNGFNSIVTDILVNFDPHVRIQQNDKTRPGDDKALRAFLSQQKNVIGSGRFVSGKAMIVSKNQSKVVFIRGVDNQTIETVSGLKDKMVLGSIDFKDPKRNDLVVGFSLADKMGVVTGDTVWMISPAGSEQALLGLGAPIIRSFRIAGMYESNNKEYDGSYGYMSLAAAQRLLQLENNTHGYELRLSSIDDADNLKQRLIDEFDGRFDIQTWYDLHRDLYSVMKIERWTAFIILCLIVAVASFNLLGSMTMSVIEKTRDIGILKTMGATNADIIAIFRFEGALVGIVGIISGTALGLFVCWLQVQYHLFPLDPTVYIIPAIPIEIRITDFIAITVATMLLCYGAAIYPAYRAAALQPAEAIRWE
ncbi:MAG TPA: ABC transporter permease, partial [Bacteroidota bacterium]|nr:ABC transporter permease [Bacteroidota bacterium]